MSVRKVQVPSTLSGMRVDKVVATLVPGISRVTAKQWIEAGRVKLGERPCRCREQVTADAWLEIQEGPAPTTRAEADPRVVFQVVYEDESLLVVEKPAGLVVHPAKGNWEGTLVNGLLARGGFEVDTVDERDAGGHLRPGIVHRIDKDTSGLLVVAKTAGAREGLKGQFAAHSIDREYLALTAGVPKDSRICTPYGRHPRSRLRFCSRVKQGKNAITEIHVVERLLGGRVALVRCRLFTGRTHQVRVHLAEQANTPILGDKLYGRPREQAPWQVAADALGRQALHAALLGFVHPTSGESLRFESPLPDDMQRTLSWLRAADQPA